MLSPDQRAEIRNRVTAPFRDLSDILAVEIRVGDGYCRAHAKVGPMQVSARAEMRIEQARRRLMLAEQDAERRRRDAIDDEADKRAAMASTVVADFLGHMGRREIAKKHGLNVRAVGDLIRGGTTEDQRHRVWKFHQSRRTRKYLNGKRGQVLQKAV